MDWTEQEDNLLLKTYENKDNTIDFSKIFPNKSSSNIYIRKLVLANNMMEKDKKSIDYVCNLLDLKNDDLICKISSKLNKDIKRESNKNKKQINKNVKKVSEYSHANLLYSYNELKEQLNRIEEKIDRLKSTSP